MAILNMQSGAFRIGAGSSNLPSNFAGVSEEKLIGKQRKVVIWTDDAEQPNNTKPGAPPPTTSLDILALYEHHVQALRVDATLRPQRRSFLAIRALEEELAALDTLKRTQWWQLYYMDAIYSPNSYQVVDKKRIGRYRAEAKLTDQAVEKIQLGITEIRNLSLVGNKLRCQVREDLDVLDEGHGYAIRVFTLVTLIFLPLSFFTSFFGMNTTDIRNMPLSSSAYWATAVPATILILCSAYIYAYKWETLAQRVYRDGWVNRAMVKWSGGGLDQTVASREGFRLRSRFGRRGRSTSRSYEEWGHKDTWGMSRGDTMTAGAQV
ncbi:hypothetical protein LZ32DRAFT_256806 [Colletotrichum eremochloae]|nr:hypothetical protein LZ32DRAFT_256806 [Colletotrichum eremochloae]